jgi:hypothetical protein
MFSIFTYENLIQGEQYGVSPVTYREFCSKQKAMSRRIYLLIFLSGTPEPLLNEGQFQ